MLPLVTGKSSPMSSIRSRTARATSASCRHASRRHRGRGRTPTASPARARRLCRSRQTATAAHALPAPPAERSRPDRTRAVDDRVGGRARPVRDARRGQPVRVPTTRAASRRTADCSTPLGHRLRVTGRPAMCGIMHLGDRGVVVEDLLFVGAGRRVQHLVGIGQRTCGARRVRRSAVAGRPLVRYAASSGSSRSRSDRQRARYAAAGGPYWAHAIDLEGLTRLRSGERAGQGVLARPRTTT